MNILFLTIGRLTSISSHAIYTDLLRQFLKDGHKVYTVSAYEKRDNKQTELVKEGNALNLHVKIGNITKSSMLEKGIATLLIPYHYKKAIKKFFKGVKFDLILYSTPPITLLNVISYLKKESNAKTYLLLKDIFPQNAVDLGIINPTGLKGVLYKYFKRLEKSLYTISDKIGCMSPANVEYLLKNNQFINKTKVEICPNCIEYRDVSVEDLQRKKIRDKYNIPNDKKIFVYGGNLGKPQNIGFIIECLQTVKHIKDAFFLIVGDGTEFPKLKRYIDGLYENTNIKLLQKLPKEDYDFMLAACDIGLIFLDYRFTIPNYPSRLLTYLQAGLPVVACTDVNSDIGQSITEGGFGWWCPSNDANKFYNTIVDCLNTDLTPLSINAKNYLLENFTAESAYKIIKNSLLEK